MNIVDFITFILVMAMMLFLFFKRVWDEKYQAEHPEEVEEQQRQSEEEVREFLKSLEMDLLGKKPEEAIATPPRAPPISREMLPSGGREQQLGYQAKTGEEAELPYPELGAEDEVMGPFEKGPSPEEVRTHEYDVQGAGSVGPSYARRLIYANRSLKEIALYHEIFGPSGGRIKRDELW